MFEIIPSRSVVILYPIEPDEETIELGFDTYNVMIEVVAFWQILANSGTHPWSVRWLEIRSRLIQMKLIPPFPK